MADELLRVEKAAFGYEGSNWRLKDVSFALDAGEVLAVIGPNGSGKSTLLKLAAGVLAPRSGRVQLDGTDMVSLDRREVARRLGYLPQQVAYAFDYTVEDVVAMGRFPHLSGMGFLAGRDLDVVESSLRQTEMLPYRARPLSHLSGGERQRAYLASVLAQEPRVLLLDEPTSALDLHHQARFFRLLRNLARGGIAVAVVLHDLNIASFYCSRLLLLSDGASVRDGAPEEVLRQDVLREVYGESVNVERDARTGKPIVLPGVE